MDERDPRQAPSFTIVIPTFQRAQMVAEAAEAVGRIEYGGQFDLIVSIDGSTDDTARQLRLLDLPCPLTVLDNANLGAGAARNRGAEAASGEVILFLDDDMLPAPDILTHHAREYLAGADAVIGDIPVPPAEGSNLLLDNVARRTAQRSQRLAQTGTFQLFDLLGGHISVRRQVFADLGGFDESYTAGGGYGHEDADFGLRLVATHDVRFSPRAVAWHRYSVSVEEYLVKLEKAGFAALRFAERHLDKADDLFAPHGPTSFRKRYLFAPLIRIPGAVTALRKLTAFAVDRVHGRAAALDVAIEPLFGAACAVHFWSGVHQAGQEQKAGVPGPH